jgi:hypothetical protein
MVAGLTEGVGEILHCIKKGRDFLAMMWNVLAFLMKFGNHVQNVIIMLLIPTVARI